MLLKLAGLRQKHLRSRGRRELESFLIFVTDTHEVPPRKSAWCPIDPPIRINKGGSFLARYFKIKNSSYFSARLANRLLRLPVYLRESHEN